MAQLKAVATAMREVGVLSWEGTIGDAPAKIVLGPLPPKPKAKGEDDPRAEKRAHYANLLGRHVSDGELDALP